MCYYGADVADPGNGIAGTGFPGPRELRRDAPAEGEPSEVRVPRERDVEGER
jgi:hypothetical protein